MELKKQPIDYILSVQVNNLILTYGDTKVREFLIDILRLNQEHLETKKRRKKVGNNETI